MTINRFLIKLLCDILPMFALIIFSFGEIFVGTKYIIIGFLCVLPFFISYFKKFGSPKYIVLFYVATLIGSLANLLTTQNGIGGTILFMTTLPLAIYCLTHLSIIKYVSLIVLIYNLLFISTKIFIEYINPEYIYESIGLSRNYPGYLLVVWTVLWSFTKYVTERKISIILPVLSFILSFFLEGRASMGILFFIAIISCYLRNKNTIYLFPILVIFLVYRYWEELVILFEMTRFSNESFDTSRFDIWGAYFKALNIPSLFFGLDTTTVPILAEYGGNPHNAFLNFHYRMGIAGLGSLLYVMATSILTYLRKKEIFILMLLFALIGRFSFDSNLNVTYDFIFYSIVFYPLIKQTEVTYTKSNLNSPLLSPFRWIISFL